MVTKVEFKELKEKYWNKEYAGKSIILTDDFPNRLLIIIPYVYWSNSDERHQIAELSKSGTSYYGCNGNQIKGIYIRNACYPQNKIIIQGGKGRDKLSFFFESPGNKIDLADLETTLYPRFGELIRDLKRNKIPISGLSAYCNCYSFRRYCRTSQKLDNDAIKKLFGLNPKDLRDFRENYTRGYVYNVIKKVRVLKQLFSCSVKDICKYIPFFDCVGGGDLEYAGFGYFSKQQLKNFRTEFQYLGNVEEFRKGLARTYIDYKRCLSQLDETNRKKWPLYPKDFSKIQKLHDDAVNFLNREADRIRVAKQVEKQNKYLENFYEKAKGLEMSDDNYSIIACKNLIDLVKEGRSLDHCVGSYVTSVSEGREYILFLRKKDDINTPYFTIDVTPEGRVRQIHGYGNCNLNEEIKPFIDKWAKKFNLDISNCSGVYRHL